MHVRVGRPFADQLLEDGGEQLEAVALLDLGGQLVDRDEGADLFVVVVVVVGRGRV